MASYDDVKTINIAYIGFMSVIGTVIIIMLLQVLYFQTRVDQAAFQEATAGPPTELANLTASQQTALTRVEVVDREKGVVTVGIKRAMNLVVSELDSGKDPKQVVGPLGPPIPGAADAPAPATSPDGSAVDNAPSTDSSSPPTEQDDSKQASGDDNNAEEKPTTNEAADDGEPGKESQPPEKQNEDKS